MSALLLPLMAIALGGHCIASQEKSTPKPFLGVAPKRIPLQFVVEPLLSNLRTLIANSESQERSQQTQVETLAQEANLNSDFPDEFTETKLPEIEKVQYQQDERISFLEERIEELKALRYKVKDLTHDATSINDVINDNIYPGSVGVEYYIEDLQIADKDRTYMIDKAWRRVRFLSAGIDELAEKAWDNLRCLVILDGFRVRATAHTNRQRGGHRDQVLVYPHEEANSTVTVEFNPAYLGIPEARFVGMTGFHMQKDKHEYYAKGLPSMYFGANTIYDNNQVQVTGMDMSSGTWINFVVSQAVAEIDFVGVKLPDLKVLKD